MKSNAERQAELRERRLEQGETELRGVYVKKELHKIIKEKIRKLLKK